jgi:hypothetical protein
MKKMMFLFVLLAGMQAVVAQTSFTGTWELASSEHIAGPEYSNALPKKMTIRQEKDSFYIESTSMGGDGKDVTVEISYAMDGKSVTGTNAASKRKYIRTLEWSADKKSLTLTTVIYIPENDNAEDMTRVEVWTLEENKLLVHKKSIETRSETWELKGVFAAHQ